MKKFILILTSLFLFGSIQLNSGTTNKIWVPTAENLLETSTIQKPVRHVFKQYTHSPRIILDPEQKECLALNIYFEAAIESTAGKVAVAQVTLNRVNSSRFPNTICKVVKEGSHFASGHPKRDMCQFSWYCDGKHDNPNQSRAWEESKKIAEWMLKNPFILDITDGATHYHADYISAPRWARKTEQTVMIDTHIFYNKTNNFNF